MSRDKIDYTMEHTIGDWDIETDDGCQSKGVRIDITKIAQPHRKEPGAYRSLWMEFRSSDYPEGQDARDDVEPEHPEFDALFRKGGKVRVRLVVERIE